MNRKFKNIVYKIVAVLLFLCIILNTYLLLKYNILPAKYLLIYGVIVVLIPLLLILFTLFKKRKSKLKRIACFIEILYILVLAVVFLYLNRTFNFLDRFTNDYNYETKNYYVLVLNSSSYSDIKDINNKKIGYTVNVGETIKEALDKLSENVKLTDTKYDGYGELFDALDNGEIDSLLILQSYYDLLKENEEDGNGTDYRIIHKFSVKVEAKEIEVKEVDVTKEAFNIYISGIDTYGSVTDNSRSDVNILMSVNPKTNKILLINIPRDYYVERADVHQKDKLTHAGMQGVDVSVKTIEMLFDTEINYYVKVNYNALIKLVDALDGVDVYSEFDFSSYEYHYRFKKGYNHVNGKKALDFVRTRKAFAGGDRVRGENQQRMIEAIIKKASSASVLLKYDSLLKALEGNFATNMSTNSITSLINKQLKDNKSWEITNISVNGKDGHETTASTPHQELYVMIPDEETVLAASNAIKELMQ